MAEQKKTVTRETVRVGLDFSPIVLEIGDGTEWSFTRHPSPALFGALAEACSAFQVLTEETQHVGDTMVALADDLLKALTAVLEPVTQAKPFTAKGYSLTALQWFAGAVIEDSTGFPTG